MNAVPRPASAPLDADALRERLRTPDAGIPVLPALAQRVMALAADPGTPVWRIAGVVSKDQVLAARLLGLANSAYCAPLSPIGTVTDAIVRMGTAAVRNLVVTVCFTSRMYDSRVYGSRGQALVDHGLGTAYLARLVAERAGVNTDEAFLYGLLHDIGKLVILKIAFDEARHGGGAAGPDVLDTVIAGEHAAIGGAVLERWHLPPELAGPVAWHHEPDRAAGARQKAVVAYLANRLSHRYGFGVTAAPEEAFLENRYAREIGLDAGWLAELDAHAPGLFEVARMVLA